jgi:hypothetical protein
MSSSSTTRNSSITTIMIALIAVGVLTYFGYQIFVADAMPPSERIDNTSSSRASENRNDHHALRRRCVAWYRYS